MKKRRGSAALAWLALATLAYGQETVNGGMVVLGPLQSNGSAAAVDFTASGSTAPVKAGSLSARPGTCSVGQMYFATDAAPGQNLSYCTGTGTWTIGTGGGGSATCQRASALGFALNGTDETALLNSTLANFYAGGGGCLAIDAGKTLRADSQITLPAATANSTSNGVAGRQPWYRITGAGGAFSPFGAGLMTGGSTLDLRYHRSGFGQFQGGPKMLGVGMGVLEIDHVLITTGATSDCATFVMTTGTVPMFHDFAISGTGCNGGIVIGGSAGIGSSYPANAPLAAAVAGWFQGYGGSIRNVALVGLGNATAPAILLQSQVNQFFIEDIWIGQGGSANPYLLNVGGAYSSSPGAAIDIEGHGAALDADRSNIISKGIIEMGGARAIPGLDYACGVKMHYAEETAVEGVGFYDGNSATYAFCGDGTAIKNRIERTNFLDSTGTQHTNASWSTNNYMPYPAVGVFFDGGGATLTGTTTRCSIAPFGGVINQFLMAADQPGAATVTVKTIALGSYTGPSSATDISNGGETMTASVSKQDSALTGWTYSGTNPKAGPLPANTMVSFTLSNPSAITWLAGQIQLWEGR